MDPDGRSLFARLARLTTEAVNPRTTELDTSDTRELVATLNAEDQLVAPAVEAVLDAVAAAVDLAVPRLREGGRIVYVGAGTSGRLGVLDAAECPPTFGTHPDQVVGVIAGGRDALVRSIEGAEDDPDAAIAAMTDLAVGPNDLVVAIAASWRTPYTVAAVTEARGRGAATAYVTTNLPDQVGVEVDVLIAPQVGPEPVMGSTRMKSGTAQKLVLNLLSTATMIRLGKVYGNMMVDLQATNQKLTERSKRVVMIATGLDYDAASARLDEADGHVKVAVVMEIGGLDAASARSALSAADGHVRRALGRDTEDACES